MGNFSNIFQFKGCVIVATGATGYLCQTFIKSLAEAGANIAAIDMPSARENLVQLADSIREKYHININRYCMDISNELDVKETCATIINDFGKIDGLINAAGINQHGNIEDYTEEDIQNLMRVNIAGTFACCKYFGKEMCKNRKGSIVNIASYTGTLVSKKPRTMSGYDISKAGVVHLTKAVAAEFGEYQVRCNSISPGFLEKGMSNVKNYKALKDMSFYDERMHDIPMGRVASANELIGAVLYYLSDASTYTTGTDLLIDGGLHIW